MTLLGYIDKKLSNIINYELGLWTQELKFPFWVGEYQETVYSHELGYHEYTFILTGTARGTWKQLEEDKNKIRNLFSNHTALIEKGHSVAVFFDTAFMLPSEDEQTKRMLINLTIKEWGKE